MGKLNQSEINIGEKPIVILYCTLTSIINISILIAMHDAGKHVYNRLATQFKLLLLY